MALTGRVGARVAASGLQALVLILLARTVGPTEFGIFAIALSVGTITAAILGFGASTRILRLGAEVHSSRIASTLFLLRILGTILTLVISILSGIFLGGIGLAVIAASAMASAELLSDFTQAHMAGLHRQGLSSGFLVGQKAILGAAVLCAAPFGFTAIFSAILTASLITIVTSLIFPTRRWARPLSLVATARASAGYWAAGIVANVKNGEPIMVGATTSGAFAGAFAIVSRLINPLLIFTSALQTLFIPELTRGLTDGTFTRSFRKLMALCIIYGGFLIVFSPVIVALVLLVLGDGFEFVRSLALATVAATGFSAVAHGFQIFFISQGRPWVPSLIIGSVSVLGVVLLGFVGYFWGGDSLWICPLITQFTVLSAMFMAFLFIRSKVFMPPENSDGDADCK